MGSVLTHVQQHFVAPMLQEADDAERALEDFKWSQAFQGDGSDVKTNMDDLRSILRRLPVGRQGSDAYWIKKINDHVPEALANEYDRYVREQPYDVQQRAANNLTDYAVAISKARWKQLRRGGAAGEEQQRFMSHPAKGGGGASDACKCGHRHCPATRYADGKCDVHEEPGPYRLRSLKRFPDYVKLVNEARKKAGKQHLDFSRAAEENKPQMNSHSFSAGRAAAIAARLADEKDANDWADQEKEIAESSLADMCAEMEQLWASGPDPLTDAAQAA